MHDILDGLIRISKDIGQFLKAERDSIQTEEIEFKGRTNDLVSRADKEAERRFVDRLERLIPESGFIAEEGTSIKKGEKYNWIIDPLDGTTNYLFRIPCYCTSVALIQEGKLVLGVIYDPERDECFSAMAGEGAFLNNKPIRVSDQRRLNLSLLATGFPYDNRGKQRAYLEILENINQNTRGIRRLGSAALDMAYVACGRFDGFYEYGLNAWDCAAGAIIIKEAGGIVTDFYGQDDFLFGGSLLCSNGLIHNSLKRFTENWS